ncbi:glutaminyl-peptide cyclotransferase [Sphingobium subterraneum]|uniref:Glutamine cyclotransferase n=1 Tax=Sphingobium subterraneum TaxID=627688 RepID=A0A841J6P3_9SPHN|nr:glutaminyl-peptide cyclotransferase [Sphingobium subterraneum]MBB6123871.1 glutamine cyclotransferase [Sphingobium subterraneum]
MKRVRLLLALLCLVAPPAFADTAWKVVRAFPHATDAFTEGLIFLDGSLYESVGQFGVSQIREVRLKDGQVLRRAPIDARYFGEGLTDWNGELISLTWRHRTGFRWDRATFRPTTTFHYEGEGWGLTQDGKRLIMSDGTAQLRFFDPVTFAPAGAVTVTWNGKPVPMLNELEYVKGEVLANVWMTDRIARIDPATGKVIDWIDLGPLTRTLKLSNFDAVLNGIAYDKAADRLFVTGKYWPKLYEIRLKRK